MAKRKKQSKKFYESLDLASGQLFSPVLPNSVITAADATYYGLGEAAKTIGQGLSTVARRVGRTLKNRRFIIVAMTIIVASVAAITISGIVIAKSTFASYNAYLSNPQALLNYKNVGTTILDRHGQVLFRTYGANNRQTVSIDSLPKNLVSATLAAEDPSFYSHPGFSWKATTRAVAADILNRNRTQGGSTITQQLIKNTLLTPKKSIVRKYQEIVLAIKLEQRYSKKEILQMYLNTVYYGQGSYGVEAASETYFHKSSKDLDLPESAMLAGLPLGPSRFDPTLYPADAVARRNFVLERMRELQVVTPEQALAAEHTTIQASPQQTEIKAPWFVFYVLGQLRQHYGTDVVEKGGITVTTTLDLNYEQAAQQIVSAQINRLSYHHVTNGGLVSVDPGSGDILAMVGSTNYDDPSFGKVNVTMSELQPGSSFKPFAYVTAFEKGWTGASVVDDKPMQLPNGDGTMYVPKDYDGKWRGPVTLRRALANSLNIPAIHVIQHAGIHDTIQTARSLGISTLNDESRYGVSLVLGGGEVTPLDMATAYAAFANLGQRVYPRSVLKVQDRDGRDITKPTVNPKQQVIDPRYAYMITNILSDNKARTEEFGANSPLKLSRSAAAKTGTTNDFRDNWTVGYVPQLATAVWVGNNDHTAMQNVDGITGAAPIWHDYMETVLKSYPAVEFQVPGDMVTLTVCSSDGGLANPWDKSVFQEVFLKDNQPTKHCASQAPEPPQPDSQQVQTDQPPAPLPPPDEHKHKKH